MRNLSGALLIAFGCALFFLTGDDNLVGGFFSGGCIGLGIINYIIP